MTTDTQSAQDSEDLPGRGKPTSIEPRWPVALAISFFIAVTITLRVAVPERASLGPAWLVPGLEIAMLGALLAADPAHARERRRWLRPLSLGLVIALATAALISTGILIADLIRGGKVTESADSLLA